MLTKKQKEYQARLLREGNAHDCCVFAIHVDGADVKALQERVIEKGNYNDCFLFAAFAPGADVDRIQERADELWEEYMEGIYKK